VTRRAGRRIGLAGLLGLAGVAACSGLSEQEILDGKACTPAGDCADGYVCDDATDRCVRRDGLTTSTGGTDENEGGDGGASGAGVVANGGSATTGGAAGTGGNASGGVPTGGDATGGDASGGIPTGGDATGGDATGGQTTGGSLTGGALTGGALTGGDATGGNAGGALTGGGPTGGAPLAGASPGGAPGGMPPYGGAAGGDAGAGGAAGTGGLVPGICGDGVLNTGEECEPNEIDPCTEDCRIDCSLFGLSGYQGTEFVLPDGKRHCYYSLVFLRSFEAANAACATIGGHLATVHSDAENERVRSLVSTAASAWIGATDGLPATSPSAGTYAWISGEPFDCEPSGGFDSDPTPCTSNCGHCATIASYGASTWGVAVCTSNLVGVCEWTPPE